MTSWKIPAALSTSIRRLQQLIDQRLLPIFVQVFCGLLLTRKRRLTCTTWFQAVGITDEFQSGYRTICLTGRNTKAMWMSILFDIVKSPAATPAERIKLTLDDTLSQR